MEEKRDIFNGKIKEEYFSYILGYMIFFVVLFVGVGVLAIGAAIWGMSANSLGERIFMGSMGGSAFALATVYLVLELLVIRSFPKHERLRRILFNSDCYFTESNSKEYYGRNRRRDRAAFALVTGMAEAEKAMGKRRPVTYTIYCALSILMCVLAGASVAAMVILGENDAKRPEILRDDLTLLFLFISVVSIFIAVAIFFLLRAYKVALMAPYENEKWRFVLYTSLVDISVRRNNKKHKFWYKSDQLKEIQDLVHSAAENVEFKLERNGDRLISFEVIDTLNDRVVFTGFFL